MKAHALHYCTATLILFAGISIGGFGGYYYARAQLFDQIMGNTVRQMQMLQTDKGEVK